MKAQSKAIAIDQDGGHIQDIAIDSDVVHARLARQTGVPGMELTNHDITTRIVHFHESERRHQTLHQDPSPAWP